MKILEKNLLLNADPAPGGGGMVEKGSGAIVDDQASGGPADSADTSGDDTVGETAFDMDDILGDNPTKKSPEPNKADRQKTGLPPGVKPKENKVDESKTGDTKSKPEGEDKTGEDDTKETEGETEDDADKGEDETPADTTTSPKGNKRDYSPYTPDEVKALKKLGNREFALVAPILQGYKTTQQEATELKTKNTELLEQLAGRGIPQSWHEHPEAYTLTPEFNNINRAYTRLNQESSHYEAQLEAIEAGEEWTAITGYRNDGSPIYSTPIPASPQARARLMSLVATAATKKANYEQQAQNLRANFRHTYEADNARLDQAMTQHFSTLSKELQPVDAHVKEILGKLPPSIRSAPLAKQLARAISVIVNQGTIITGLQEASKKKAAIGNDKKLGGPASGASRPAPQPQPKTRNGKPTEFNLEEIVGVGED